MINITDLLKYIREEVSFTTTRSSGPGGQNVNKLETAVILKWNIVNSNCFSEEQKEILLQKLKNRLNNSGELVLRSEVYRSQIKNKEDSLIKLLNTIKISLKKEKRRIKIHPSKISNIKRLENKKRNSEIKNSRKKFRF